MRTFRLLLVSALNLLFVVAMATAADVVATRIDGASVTGSLKSWDTEKVVLFSADGEQQLSVKELLAIRWNAAAAPNAISDDLEAAATHLELTDGTVLPFDSFHSTGTEAKVVLSGTHSADDKELSLERRQLAAVRLQPLDKATQAQWDEIRAMDLAGDVLVVTKRDGKSLDYVEGVLGNVSDEKVKFELEGEPVRIDRAKVAGFIYFRRDDSPTREPAFVIHGLGGLRLTATSAQVSEHLIEVTTAAGAKVKWPLAEISWVDFSAGKLLYLSDLEPASERWTPLVALPAGTELATTYGKARRDKSAYGGPLALQLSDGHAPPSAGNAREFAKGLALRSRTELVYRLPAGFRKLIATAGIDPATSSSGFVRLQIFANDRPLLETNIAGHEAPHEIELDIADAKRLKIVVDYGNNLDTGDWLNLCDARILK